MYDEVKGIIANKLTLEKYRELKNNGETGYDEIYTPTDIDEYVPTYKESLDTNNPIILRNLETGIYKIYGYFRYYSTQSGISAVDPFAFVVAEKGSAYSYVTILSSNSCERYKITDTGYEDLEDTGWIDLSYASGYSAGNATQLQYRCKKGFVTIRGGATGTFTSGSYTRINSTLLPSQYRPLVTTRNGAMGSGMRPCGVEINVDGTIKVGTYSTSMPTWIAFCVTYPI